MRFGVTDTVIVRIPISMPRDGKWIEEIEEELTMRGILAKVEEQTKWPRIDKLLIYDILTWRCWRHGGSMCPAIVFSEDKASLLMLDEKEDKFVKVLDFEKVMVEEIQGQIRYSECLEKYGYDFPC